MVIKPVGSTTFGTISVFVQEKYKDHNGQDKQNVEIFHVSLKGDIVFDMEHLLKKGSKVLVSGPLKTRKVTQSGVESEYKYISTKIIQVLYVKGGELNE